MSYRNYHKTNAPEDALRERAYSHHEAETQQERLYRMAFEEGLARGYRRGYEDGHNNGYHEGYEDRIRDQQYNERSVIRHHEGDMKWHRQNSKSWRWV